MNFPQPSRAPPEAGRILGASPWVQGEAGLWPGLFRDGHRLGARRGFVILQPGQPCDCLYYLESGRVAVTINWHDGSEKVIGVVFPGTIFGETFFFRPDLANASVRADRDSVIYSLGRDAVTDYLESNPTLALNLIQTLTRKMWMLIKQIEDLCFRSVEGRVASLLYTLAAAKSDSGRSVVLDLTHSAIADLVGAHRVSVNNAMLSLQHQGFVELRPRKVAVKDLASLYALGFPSPEWPEPTAGGAFAALD